MEVSRGSVASVLSGPAERVDLPIGVFLVGVGLVPLVDTVGGEPSRNPLGLEVRVQGCLVLADGHGHGRLLDDGRRMGISPEMDGYAVADLDGSRGEDVLMHPLGLLDGLVDALLIGQGVLEGGGPLGSPQDVVEFLPELVVQEDVLGVVAESSLDALLDGDLQIFHAHG